MEVKKGKERDASPEHKSQERGSQSDITLAQATVGYFMLFYVLTTPPPDEEVRFQFSKQCGNTTSTGLALRVVGGRYLEEGEHPFLALLIKDSYFICGGSIISKRFVLTAAHCIEDKHPLDNFYAVFGTHDKTQKFKEGVIQYRAVERIITHPDYYETRSGILINDIALLQVGTIHFNARVQPICLPDSDLSRFKAAKIQGWGSTNFKGKAPRFPKEAILSVLTEQECRMSPVQPMIRHVHDIHHAVVCAYERATDACQGDSGGPLFISNEKGLVYQIGIVSFGLECGNTEDIPSMYTRLSSYMDWIKLHIDSVCSAIA
ncbi:hypothetical protein J6590_059425 [Homalodisca vitripennis]|nr:hypothetical protein J6590_092666 [Homalodisca vitripennis]KAG8320865.1 hypothetical protein J6590_059425 [Homalodisca vitripennis]